MLGKSFQFKVSGKDLDAAIKKATSCLSNSASGTRSFSLSASKNGDVTIIAVSNDTMAAIKVDNVKDSTPGIFSFDTEIMLGLIKGRDDLSFNVTEHECSFKAVKTNYSGKLFTIPVLSEVIQVANTHFQESDASAVLSVDVISRLREGLPLVALKDPYSGSEMLINFAVTKDKKVKLACIDGYHMSVYESTAVKFKGEPIELVMSLPLFHLIEKTIGVSKADFTVTDGNLRIATDTAILVLPRGQITEEKYKIAYSYYGLVSPVDFTCEVVMSQLNAVISNVSTLYSDNTYLEFMIKAGSDTMSITLSSNNGEATDAIQLTAKKLPKKTLKFVIDPRILKDCLSVASQQQNVQLQLRKGQAFLLKGESKLQSSVYVACSLAESRKE